MRRLLAVPWAMSTASNEAETTKWKCLLGLMLENVGVESVTQSQVGVANDDGDDDNLSLRPVQ